MSKASIPIFIAIAISINLLFYTTTANKSSYHSLYLSSSLSSNDSIANHLYILTRRPHVAGTQANADAASYVLSTLTSFNITSHIAPYYSALTYPVSRSLVLTNPSSQKLTEFELRQEIYKNDPYADVADQVLPSFHGFAKSGNASGPVVYVNYGRVEDYTILTEMGVNVSGSIALAKYGRIFRGDIVRNAYMQGAIGVLIYTDRLDFGGGGGDVKWFPDDRWMPPTGVQMGSVFTGRGDPTTPGWSSTEDCERLSNDEMEETGNVPLIPSLPISWSDGDAIIKSIGGQRAQDDWQGGENAPVYRVGPGPGVVNLTYLGKQVISRIENVIGIIEGEEEPDRYVILGNHRDAWTFGAVDPNSGTACLLEVAERLFNLQKKGWKPRRTIILCNWDAEEYGVIGSTEWVEENRAMLTSRVVAYMNVDVAVAGPGFHPSATPQLDELLILVAKQVQDPDNSSQSIYDSWSNYTNNPVIGRLGGGGSDYSAFVQHIGIPSTDMVIGTAYPVYHSMYDDFVWMSKYGDPMFQRHVAVASIWGLLALKLADDKIIPFNYVNYAEELQRSADVLNGEILDQSLTLAPLLNSIKELKEAAIKINAEKKALEEKKGQRVTWKHAQKVRTLNDRLMMAERAFTDPEGLQGRPWYKHLIYASSTNNIYGSRSFPGIGDALETAQRVNTSASWHSVQHEIWRVSRAITQASLCLKGELT